MKDTKSLLLLLVSLLLILVSFVLVWTWGYNYYSNNNDKKSNTITASIDSASIANRLRDSLQKEYTATLQSLDLQLDSTIFYSDSLQTQLDVKLAEFYRLRTEIVSLLKNKSTANNYATVTQKINELQTKAEDLKVKNQDVEKENKKLNEVLSQINNTEKVADKNVKNESTVKSNNTEKPNTVFSAFTVSDLRLTAIINTGEKETETTAAEKTEKFNGSFTVMNFNSQLTNAEMMVVVLNPDGFVLKSSGWDSGTFNTPEGKKVYSYKFNFNYSRGEAKRLLFSMRTGTLAKGNYILEVYHNGVLIGRTVKTL